MKPPALTLPAAASWLVIALLAAPAGPALAADPAPAARPDAAPQVTIYNQNFALVKERSSFALKEGVNEVRVTDVTAQLEPDSVILRDLKDPKAIRILEQNYEGDPLSQGFLLSQNEGKTLRFEVLNPATGKAEVRSAKLIRSGYVPHQNAWYTFGNEFAMRQQALIGSGGTSPIVEMDGTIRFSLPGQPLFDALGADAILKPTVLWTLGVDQAGTHDVELSYMTGGLRWEATYNVVAPEKGDRFDLVGWVTLENESGAEFRDARVKLMAGEVNKVVPAMRADALRMKAGMMAEEANAPPVTEKAFDEYHLYTLQRPTTLKDREIKQVEFCRAADVPATRLYVYDGETNPTKVVSMLEFNNGRQAGLGMPLPKGTMKIYRADSDGRREFIGESGIDHTPADEKVRIRLGNAFDLAGERRQTNEQVDSAHRKASEAYEIKIRNHKKESVEVRLVEHLERWAGWKIALSSDPYTKTDASTVEFRVKVPAGGEEVVTYEARYSW